MADFNHDLIKWTAHSYLSALQQSSMAGTSEPGRWWTHRHTQDELVVQYLISWFIDCRIYKESMQRLRNSNTTRGGEAGYQFSSPVVVN